MKDHQHKLFSGYKNLKLIFTAFSYPKSARLVLERVVRSENREVLPIIIIIKKDSLNFSRIAQDISKNCCHVSRTLLKRPAFARMPATICYFCFSGTYPLKIN
jgi:hypothetical protein